MNNIYIKPTDKEQAKTLKWLHSGCSKDQARQVLTGIEVQSKYTYSTDGFRLMRIETPEYLVEYEGKVIKPLNTLPANPQVIEWEEVDGTFPDCEQVIETDKPEYFSFAVNKKLLADAIKTMPGDDMITLSFTGNKEPVRITTDDALLLIMPMHLDDAKVYPPK